MDILIDSASAAPAWLAGSAALTAGVLSVGSKLGFELAQREQLRGAALARRPAGESPLQVVQRRRSL